MVQHASDETESVPPQQRPGEDGSATGSAAHGAVAIASIERTRWIDLVAHSAAQAASRDPSRISLRRFHAATQSLRLPSATAASMAARIRKAVGSDVKWATKPMAAGPAKIPA